VSFERCSEPSGVTESTHCASRCGAAAHCCDVLCCASYDIVNSFFVISIPSGSWSDGPIGRFELSNFASPANDCVTCRKHVREIVTVVSWRQNTHTHTQRLSTLQCHEMRWGRQGMRKPADSLESVNLNGREGEGRTTVWLVFTIQCLKMWGGLTWLVIVSSCVLCVSTTVS